MGSKEIISQEFTGDSFNGRVNVIISSSFSLNKIAFSPEIEKFRILFSKSLINSFSFPPQLLDIPLKLRQLKKSIFFFTNSNFPNIKLHPTDNEKESGSISNVPPPLISQSL